MVGLVGGASALMSVFGASTELASESRRETYCVGGLKRLFVILHEQI